MPKYSTTGTQCKQMTRVASRNNIACKDFADMTYSQIIQLDGVGKKLATAICTAYNIPMRKTPKEVVRVGGDVFLVQRTMGKRTKRKVWDFPSEKTIRGNIASHEPPFSFWSTEVNVVVMHDDASVQPVEGSTTTCTRVPVKHLIDDTYATGEVQLHPMVSSYAQQLQHHVVC
jgi:hypothetical protein